MDFLCSSVSSLIFAAQLYEEKHKLSVLALLFITHKLIEVSLTA